MKDLDNSSNLDEVASVLLGHKEKYEYLKSNVLHEYHKALSFVQCHDVAVQNYEQCKEDIEYKEPKRGAEYYFEAQGMLKALEKIKNCL